jgi:hypothetical protein
MPYIANATLDSSTSLKSKEELSLKYENFKIILQNYLFNLTKMLVKCIINTIDDNFHELDRQQQQQENEDTNDDFNYEININIMNLLNTTNNKSLLFAYTYLIENIDENLFMIPESDYEKQFKNFKKSLKKIYSFCDLTTFSSNYEEQQQQQFASNFMPFYDTGNVVEDKGFYYDQTYPVNEKLNCSINELKMLHFILLLFSKFINFDFDLSLFNCSLKNICNSANLEVASTKFLHDTNSSVSLVRVACIKTISKLIDQLCVDKLIKTKILLNASDLD